MACPTCDHTVSSIGDDFWWCPRCGTLVSKNPGSPDGAVPPSLVDRVRKFRDIVSQNRTDTVGHNLWRRCGIEEAINIPSERKL